MKYTFTLSIICAAMLHANELAPLEIEGTELKDVSGEEIKSADLGDALAKKVPSVSMVRRSGIANDIIVRGQKKDNINVLIDDAKVHGACPNRMDPPISHVLTNNVESIDIVEGPYDVEHFGTLSSAVYVETKKPSEKTESEVNLGLGSFNYRKAAASVSGGDENVRILLSASTESSDQYVDGDGDTMAEQLAANTDGTPNASFQYHDDGRSAFQKDTFMGKLFFTLSDNEELKLGYTTNRSYNILYPSSKMDALYDFSNIYTVDYTLKNLGAYSKAVELELFHSDVDHPMSTRYRKAAVMMMMEMTSALTTQAQGIKLKNRFDLGSTSMLVGIDTNTRNWDGTYYRNDMAMGKSISDADTKNQAIFAEASHDFDALRLKAGLRYDDTTVTPSSTQTSHHYSALNANLYATYQATEGLKLFAGAGKSSRVPDARELYFLSSKGVEVGTPTLDQTTNTEADIGFELNSANLALKSKLFYSMLENYVYYNSSNTITMGENTMTYHAFENIDATLYGFDLSASYLVTDTLTVDAGIAYQRGQKDKALAGQGDKDLAEVAPLRGNLALGYEYADESSARIEVIASDKWSDFDADNGEQAIDAYTVLNLRVDHTINESFGVTVGVDNVLDEAYALSNTYYDLTLLPAGGGDVMLLNEPGRYFYVNGKYRF